MHLKDKVVWISGASSGIGEALAYQCAKEGAKIVLSARRENELQRVAKATNLSDKSYLVLPLDLADTSNVQASTRKRCHQPLCCSVSGASTEAVIICEDPMTMDNRCQMNVIQHIIQQRDRHYPNTRNNASKTITNYDNNVKDFQQEIFQIFVCQVRQIITCNHSGHLVNIIIVIKARMQCIVTLVVSVLTITGIL